MAAVITCQHLVGTHCRLVAETAGINIADAETTPQACEVCTKTPTPETCEMNSVVASLAIGALRRQKQESKAAALHAELQPYLLKKDPEGPALVMGECPHLQDDHCAIAGALAGIAVRVREKTCEFCSRSDRPGPRQGNTVTAAAAMRHLRAHGDQELLREKTPEIARLLACKQRDVPLVVDPRAKAATRIRLVSDISPGDVMTMTAAVRSLHAAHPGRYAVAVRTTCMEIWENNPDVVSFPEDAKNVLDVAMHYPAINRCNQTHVPFLAGYAEFLGSVLGLEIPLATNRPMLYLSDEEKQWMPQVDELTGGRHVDYWVVNAGVKSDYTAKQWPVENYQDVVNETGDRIQWVQIGESHHDHPPLKNVIDLRGKTDARQLIRLVYHSHGGLGPVTWLQHLCAAWQKPYICLLGGREPVTWVTYPLQHTLHTMGLLECCETQACWRSRVQPAGDGDEKDQALCEWPVITGQRAVGKCMQMIPAEAAIEIVRRYT